MNPSNPINLLTVDLEDYFQVHAFSNVVKLEDWRNYESRIERNTHRLLEILNECSRSGTPQHRSTAAPCSPRATFFVLGWIAERYPDLIRRIKDQGHEIACHGYSHQLIYQQSKEGFREDIRKAKAILEDIIGEEVIGYRAPSYSITNKSQWAFEVLMEEEFQYDSSVFPIHHDFYGFPSAPRFPFLISQNGNGNFEFSILDFHLNHTQSSVNPINSSNPMNPINPSNSSAAPHHDVTPQSAIRIPHSIVEFPLSTVKVFGQNVPISGGGYFRLFPYSLVRKGLRKINEEERKPFIFYIHPWEIDSRQPRINNAGKLSRFRHYVNLDKTEMRLKKLLEDFQFSTSRKILEEYSTTVTSNTIDNQVNSINPTDPTNSITHNLFTHNS